MSLTARSKGDKAFDAINVTVMTILMFITLYPFWFSIIGSFNEGLDYMRGGVNLWPRKWTLANYRAVFTSGDILQAYKITVLRTIVGTVTHLVVTSMFAYAFSRRNLVGKKIYATMGVITMFFHGGLIPNYLLFKTIGILNSFWVYIFPALFNFFNVVIFTSFFRNIPESINESARMDGANEYTIYTRLIVPLSKPVFAALALFTGVYHWNDFFMSLVFTNDKALEVMQVFLLRVIQTREVASQMAGAVANQAAGQAQTANSTTIQLATMVIAAAPILALYPFLQKYFVKGVLIGSIKG